MKLIARNLIFILLGVGLGTLANTHAVDWEWWAIIFPSVTCIWLMDWGNSGEEHDDV